MRLTKDRTGKSALIAKRRVGKKMDLANGGGTSKANFIQRMERFF